MSPACLNPQPLRTVYWDSDRYPDKRGHSFRWPRYTSLFGDDSGGQHQQFACQFGRYNMWFSTSHLPEW